MHLAPEPARVCCKDYRGAAHPGMHAFFQLLRPKDKVKTIEQIESNILADFLDTSI
jgi:hypothetical protein